jgi:carbamoyl-phosphate synthase large subunit
VQALAEMGYRITSTRGTAATLRASGIKVEELPKIQEGRPNLLDKMKNHEVALVINTPSGKGARTDEGKIRAAAVANGVTCITTLAAAEAAVEACRALRQCELTVTPVQDWFKEMPVGARN